MKTNDYLEKDDESIRSIAAIQISEETAQQTLLSERNERESVSDGVCQSSQCGHKLQFFVCGLAATVANGSMCTLRTQTATHQHCRDGILVTRLSHQQFNWKQFCRRSSPKFGGREHFGQRTQPGLFRFITLALIRVPIQTIVTY